MSAPNDITLRHTKKAIMSYVDSHVELTANTMGVVFFKDNTLLNGMKTNGSKVSLDGDDEHGFIRGYNKDNNAADLSAEALTATFFWLSGTKQIKFESNHGPQAIYTLPADKFKNDKGQAPTEWWGLSVDLKFETRDTSMDRLVCYVDILNGSANPGQMLGRLYIQLWGWNNDNNFIGLLVGGNSDAANPVDKKVIFKPTAIPTGTGWDGVANQPTIKAAFSPGYQIINSTKKLEFVIDKNGVVTIGYGGYSASGKISGVNFNSPPRLRFAHSGATGNIYISNLKFGCN